MLCLWTRSGNYPPASGLFCLAPRELIARSRGRRTRLGPAEWIAQPPAVHIGPGIREGTELSFPDGLWTLDLVELNVVFTCVDKIEVRKLLWDSVKEKVECRVDGRMSAEVLRVLTACDPASRMHYPTTRLAASLKLS